MEITPIHGWNHTPKEALALQAELKARVRLAPLPLTRITHIAGADIAISKNKNLLVCAVVVMTFPGLDIIEIKTSCATITFPYVPGLLSFREVPVLIKTLKKISTRFEVMLCDGQGIAHPRRLGLASHAGLFINTPTIGCAKSRLVGTYEDVSLEKGSYSTLAHDHETVGNVLRTRDNVKPLFISPGHLIDIPSSRRIVLKSLTAYRLPEPTRQAHILAEKKKREIEG